MHSLKIALAAGTLLGSASLIAPIASAMPTSVVELLNIVADHELARAQALKKFVTALQPLVASLTPEQKRRVPTFLGLGAPGPHGPSSGDLWIFEEED